jgi:hypothetical protein
MSMLTILLLVVAAAAQAPVSTPVPVPAPAPAPVAERPDPTGYAYNPQGRRDPFLSLVGRGTEPAQAGAPAAGMPGLLIDEVIVKGVIRGRSGYIAMVQASDKKTYIVRTGDRLLDGAVKSITHEGVVFSQDVKDPLSLVKQRDIQKRVRASEGRG